MSDVVVYVLRADQRDFAIDEMMFKNLFNDSANKSKVIIALNYSDKVEPINRKPELSDEQIQSLNRKVTDLSEFSVLTKMILFIIVLQII